jgi:hypothetical protein
MPDHRAFLCAAALGAAILGAALLAVPAAQAFTLHEGAKGADANALAPGLQPYLDPQDKGYNGAQFDDKDKSTVQGDGFTLQFNGPRQPFDQRYNPDNLYNPYRR